MRNIIVGMILITSLLFSGCVPLLIGGFIGYEVSEERRHQEWMEREQRKLDEIWSHNEYERWRYYNKRKLTSPEKK